jgi:hypothetical protein
VERKSSKEKKMKKARRNPIVGTRPAKKQPPIFVPTDGYEPAELIWDQEPLSPHPSMGLQGFGLIIVPNTIERENAVGYDVVNHATGEYLTPYSFRKIEHAIA